MRILIEIGSKQGSNVHVTRMEDALRKYSQGFVQKDRNQWRAVISWQEDGKRRKLRRSTGVRCYPDKCDTEGNVIKQDNRGKGAAEEFLRKWRDELVSQQEELEFAPPACETTLYDYAKNYYDLLHVKESSRIGYHAALSRLIGTDAGNTKLCDLKTSDLYAWERDMYEDGLRENTVAHYHAFVAQVLKHAVNEGDIARSPVVGMRAPKRRPKPVNALTQSGAETVLERARSMGTSPLAVSITLALTSGMRRAEICALRWLDIDIEKRVMHVTHGLSKAHGGFRMDTPKDPAGGDATRDIEFGAGLADLFVRRKAAMLAEAVSVGIAWDDTLFVTGTVDGRFKNPEILDQEWAMLMKLEGWKGTQGQPLRFHDLRHAFATLAIANGMDVMVLARILGHRDATTTLNVYATALADAKRDGMERMDALMFQGASSQVQERRPSTRRRGRHFRAEAQEAL